MAVALTGTDAAQIALSSTESWERRDLDNDYGSLPANTSGVILVFHNSDVSDRRIGAREYNNSNFTLATDLESNCRCTCYVKVDANNEVEIWREHSDITVHIVGYFTTDATWLSSPIDVTPGETESWEDINLSGYTSGGEVFALFEVDAAYTEAINFRYNGSGDNRRSGQSNGHHWAIMGLDGSDIVECNIEAPGINVYLVGFVTAGDVRTTGGSDLVSAHGTGAFEDITLPDSGKEIAILEFYNTSKYMFSVRPNGDTDYPDIYGDCQKHGSWPIVPIDGSDKAEVKIEDGGQECYCWGYLESPVVGNAMPMAMIGPLGGRIGGPLQNGS